MNNDFFSNNNAQFVLSYELLHLLQWLEKYETDKLHKIISKALANGLYETIQQVNTIADATTTQEAHHSIIDFFELLNELLTDTIKQHATKKARETNLSQTIDQIDTTICNDAIVRSSVEKATRVTTLNANNNQKEQFFIELLKQWKPHGKYNMH